MHTTLEITLELEGHTQGRPFQVHTQQGTTHDITDGPQRILVRADYHSGRDTDLIRVKGIRQGLYQRLTVRGLWLADRPLRDPDQHLAMDHGAPFDGREIAFDGLLTLATRDANRWEWTDWYRSTRRWDWVYRNARADCGSDRHCWSECGDPEQTTHLDQHRLWLNRPHDPIRTSTHTACFGCSITTGSALLRGEEWPALIGAANFAQEISGVDAIWMNLSRALEQHRIQRVILLLPSWHRRLERVTRHGETLRMPVTVTQRLERNQPATTWWTARDRERLRERAQRLLIGRDHRRRGLRIVDRIRHLLDRRRIPYWMASHDPETQRDLQHLSVIPGDRILPPFQNDRGAPDNLHASAQAHRAWVDQILPLIG